MTDVAETNALTVAPLAPLPVFSGAQMAQAMTAYRELQEALDRSMPDQIMAIGDRRFRKKGYWRALAVAFNLTVEPVDERRDVQGSFADGHDNFGWVVTYRATAPNGRSQCGDGTCYAVEKAGKFRCPHPEPGRPGRSLHFPHESCPDFDPSFAWRKLPREATEHNVRAHAHTRAYNRAVSNLVGFGEVSAEEADTSEFPPPHLASDAHVDAEIHARTPVVAAPRPAPPQSSAGEGAAISEAQDKRFYAIAKSNGWGDEELRQWLRDRWGIERSKYIPKKRYDEIVAELSLSR